MLLEDALHKRLELAVLQRGEIGEHVVLHLVVKPAVHGVNGICAGLKIGGGVSAAQQKLRGMGLAGRGVAIHVRAGVVAHLGSS